MRRFDTRLRGMLPIDDRDAVSGAPFADVFIGCVGELAYTLGVFPFQSIPKVTPSGCSGRHRGAELGVTGAELLESSIVIKIDGNEVARLRPGKDGNIVVLEELNVLGVGHLFLPEFSVAFLDRFLRPPFGRNQDGAMAKDFANLRYTG